MIETLILQMCPGSKTGPERLLDFNFVEAITCTYADPAGLLVVGLLVYGGISTAIYLNTGDVRIPAVLLLLTGGAVSSQIAAPGLAIAALMISLAGASIMTYLYYKFSR